MKTGDPFSLPLEWISADSAELLGAIRNWADRQVIPVRRELDEDWQRHEISHRLLTALCVDSGYQWAAWPEEYGGGGGMSAITSALCLEEIARADSGLATAASCSVWAMSPIMPPRANRHLMELFTPRFLNAGTSTWPTAAATTGTSKRPRRGSAGTTASAVTSLSLDPPLLLVCFERASLTLQAVHAHGAFVVNVLAAPQRHLSAHFARRGPAAAWDGVRHRPGPTDSPRLDGVLAALECTVENSLPGGDHEIVVGRVHDVETSGNDAAPLLYWRGAYTALGEA